VIAVSATADPCHSNRPTYCEIRWLVVDLTSWRSFSGRVANVVEIAEQRAPGM
jgi:hypothetical protein